MDIKGNDTSIKNSAEQILTRIMNKLVRSDCAAIKKTADKLQLKPKCEPSVEMYKKLNIAQKDIGGCHCYYLLPKNGFNGDYIFYLYGGATFLDISKRNWHFLEKVCQKTGMGIFVPLYPLAPKNSCKDVFNSLRQVYSVFSKSKDVNKIIMMGDSYGAGLALSLSLLAWEDGCRRPDKEILISPVVDTEYFDKEIETEIAALAENVPKQYYSEGIKEFINTYWVKDSAGNTVYTSPFYEDFTDVCDNVTIISGIDDIYNIYAKRLYDKIKHQGIRVSLYEFENEDHNFLLFSKSEESKKAMEYLYDAILERKDACIKDLFQLKLMADWTKRHPDIVKDDWIMRYIYSEKIDFSSINTKISEYDYYRLAAKYKSVDHMIRNYSVQFPYCTVIYLGCGLDNSFGRLDNGTIRWYSIDNRSIMALRRNMYGEREREKTIGRDIVDFSWISQVKCDRKQGVLVVCGESINHYTENQIRKLFEQLYASFPGCELILDTATIGVTMSYNHSNKRKALKRFSRKFYVNDTQKLLDKWSADYRILDEKPVFKEIPGTKEFSFITKLRILYNKISFNHRVVKLKIGSEAYDIKM